MADLAEGQSISGASEHLEQCLACQKELKIFEAMFKAFRGEIFEPSEEALARAIALMPPAPYRTARLVLGRMSPVRRAGSEEFQLVFEDGDLNARLMYQPIPTGWSVIGRIDGRVTSVESAVGKLELDESGRFRFEVEDLQETDVYINSENGIVKIPAAPEASPDGTERSD